MNNNNMFLSLRVLGELAVRSFFFKLFYLFFQSNTCVAKNYRIDELTPNKKQYFPVFVKFLNI